MRRRGSGRERRRFCRTTSSEGSTRWNGCSPWMIRGCGQYLDRTCATAPMDCQRRRVRCRDRGAAHWFGDDGGERTDRGGDRRRRAADHDSGRGGGLVPAPPARLIRAAALASATETALICQGLFGTRNGVSRARGDAMSAMSCLLGRELARTPLTSRFNLAYACLVAGRPAEVLVSCLQVGG